MAVENTHYYYKNYTNLTVGNFPITLPLKFIFLVQTVAE